ncbi:MAG: hypothetical protein LBM78_00175, partial [Clostridiales bacterium]|nr:hypothetical protein [Clostridiales bacterium]
MSALPTIERFKKETGVKIRLICLRATTKTTEQSVTLMSVAGPQFTRPKKADKLARDINYMNRMLGGSAADALSLPGKLLARMWAKIMIAVVLAMGSIAVGVVAMSRDRIFLAIIGLVVGLGFLFYFMKSNRLLKAAANDFQNEVRSFLAMPRNKVSLRDFNDCMGSCYENLAPGWYSVGFLNAVYGMDVMIGMKRYLTDYIAHTVTNPGNVEGAIYAFNQAAEKFNRLVVEFYMKAYITTYKNKFPEDALRQNFEKEFEPYVETAGQYTIKTKHSQILLLLFTVLLIGSLI